MPVKFFTLCLLFSTLAYANGRGPAVEDFVGVEMETPESTPQGTEGLFNFQKDMSAYQEGKTTQKNGVVKNSADPASPGQAMGIAVILFLPLLTVFLVMQRLRQRAKLESAANIEVLENYRREREKKQDELKKAS
jgi:hypothetical protein